MALARRPDDSPLEDVELTRMRRRHLRGVMAIETQVYPRPWSSTLFLAELSQRSTRSYLVARHGGEVVGYAGMMFTPDDAHVTNIAVDPNFHGRRVGTRLLVTLITEAIARGYDRVSLEVRVSNSVAQSMYAKFGFSVCGMRKGYYIETREDAYVMEVTDVMSTSYRLLLQDIRRELQELTNE